MHRGVRAIRPIGEMRVAPIYWSYAVVNIIVGVYLTFMPATFFSPAWWYFSRQGEFILPSGPKGMGICCIVLGVLQIFSLKFRPTAGMLATLFGISATVYWVSGVILFVEGIAAREAT